MKKILLTLAFLLMPFLLLSQTADFGDAPDISQSILWWGRPVNFHTLLGSNGPRHTGGSTSTYWIGRRMSPHVNSTTMEVNANVINNDYDDGQPFLFVYLIGIPAPAAAFVPITTSPAHNPNQDMYINVCIDVDNDMDFDGTPDVNWVVQNKKVRMPADSTIVFSHGWFGFGSDLLLFPVWLRVTVTDSPIVGVWDGSNAGSWTFGETEDWWYVFGRGGGGRGPRGGGAGGGGGGGGGGGVGGNPPDAKCVQVIYPPVIYVHCDEVKCFKVGVRNCGSIPATNIDVSFSFGGGTPLAQPPTFVPPPQQDGNITWYTFCIKGWPCGQSDGNRWAVYVIHVHFDPENHTFCQQVNVDFRNDQDAIGDAALHSFLGANPVDSSDYGPWLGTINVPMPTKHLISWTGHYEGSGIRWITGTPILTVLHMPAWATFTSTTITPDTLFWEFNGTPTDVDYGLDSAVFEVISNNPADMATFSSWKLSFQIYIQNITSGPEISTIINNTSLNISASDSIEKLIQVSDPDILLGRRDTSFIDYYLYNLNGDSIYFPDPEPVFTDSGNGTAYLKWKPGTGDIGNYRLTALSWDYYYNMDSLNALIKVVDLKSDFGAPIRTGGAPLNVQFYDSSKAVNTVIDSWLWNFGDGNSSTEQNPMHTYTNSGTFTVSLIVADGVINSSERKIGYVIVSSELLVDFTASSTIGRVPMIVLFTDLSTGGASTWSWDYGDGQFSTDQNPTHTYNNSGTYTVALTISDGTSEITATKDNYITVLDSILADFSAAPVSGDAPLEVTFTDQSLGSITSWLWDFGDGAISTEQNPVHIYQDTGTYDVTLRVYDQLDSSETAKLDYITVTQAIVMTANFTAEPLEGIIPLSVQFTDLTTGNPTSWLWNFGDEATSDLQNPVHQYNTSGTYTVVLTVSDGVNQDSLTKPDYIMANEPDAVDDEEANRIGLMNYPNPFGPGTSIQFTLDEPGEVRIEIFDVSGKFVNRFNLGIRSEGIHAVNWDGLDASSSKLSAGMFYCKLTIKRGSSIYSVTRKMVQVK